MVVSQGDVCWASLAPPRGSEPGYRRPVIVVQGDAYNASLLATVVVVPLTSNLRRATILGNVLLERRGTGLRRDSVANVSQIFVANRDELTERVGRLSVDDLQLVLAGVDVMLGRD